MQIIEMLSLNLSFPYYNNILLNTNVFNTFCFIHFYKTNENNLKIVFIIAN